MGNSKHPISKSLEEYIHTLKRHAYSDIRNENVNVEWGRTQAYAIVIWSQNIHALIRCNRGIRNWSEPALLGLLSHELSHIVLGPHSHTEHQTDRDVISRGMGPYLAIERVFTDKYSDHIIRRGCDRYLGYDSIRSLLTKHEEKQLDILMTDIGILPKKKQKDIMLHDYTCHQAENSSQIVFDGHSYTINERQKMEDIKFVIRDSSVQVLLNDQTINADET